VSPRGVRDFALNEDTRGAALVVLISETVWRQRYGSDPAIVGRLSALVTHLDQSSGVMPEGNALSFQRDIWLPIGTMPARADGPTATGTRLFAVGRLADGVTVEQSRAELQIVGKSLAGQYPKTNKDLWPHADPFLQRTLARRSGCCSGVDGSGRVRGADCVFSNVRTCCSRRRLAGPAK